MKLIRLVMRLSPEDRDALNALCERHHAATHRGLSRAAVIRALVTRRLAADVDPTVRAVKRLEAQHTSDVPLVHVVVRVTRRDKAALDERRVVYAGHEAFGGRYATKRGLPRSELLRWFVWIALARPSADPEAAVPWSAVVSSVMPRRYPRRPAQRAMQPAMHEAHPAP